MSAKTRPNGKAAPLAPATAPDGTAPVPTAASLGLSPKQFGIWQRQQAKKLKQRTKAAAAAASAADTSATAATSAPAPPLPATVKSATTDNEKDASEEEESDDEPSPSDAKSKPAAAATPSPAAFNWNCSRCRHSNPSAVLNCGACAQPKFKLLSTATAATATAASAPAVMAAITGATPASVWAENHNLKELNQLTAELARLFARALPVAAVRELIAAYACAHIPGDATALSQHLRATCVWLNPPPVSGDKRLKWKSPAATACRTALGGRLKSASASANDPNWLVYTSSVDAFWSPFPPPTSPDDWCLQNRDERLQSVKQWRNHGLVMGDRASTIYVIPIGQHFLPLAKQQYSTEPVAAMNGTSAADAKRAVDAKHITEAKRLSDRPIVIPDASGTGNLFDGLLPTIHKFCQTFFGAPVVVLPPLSAKSLARLQSRASIDSSGTFLQYQTTGIHKVLSSERKNYPNAFAIVGLTVYDLYSGASDNNFVYGEASPEQSVAVISIGRYLRYDEPIVPTPIVVPPAQPAAAPATKGSGKLSYAAAAGSAKSDQKSEPAALPALVSPSVERYDLLLRRCCKTVAHEITHLFGVDHCLYYHCVMNGANHDDEDIRQPMFLCPVDLRKLQAACGFDAVARYQKLHEFCVANGWTAEAEWVKLRLADVRYRSVTGVAPPSDG